MASIQLKVTGMTCDHCRGRVTEALNSVAGVYGTYVDLAAGTAEVDYDQQQTNEAMMIGAVEAAGYHAVPAR